MTQRLQGCENVSDVIEVAELFAPNIAPGVAGRLYILDRNPWEMRCAAEWLSPGRKMLSTPINAGPYAVVRATHRSTASRISVASICLNHKRQFILRAAHCAGEAIGLLSFQNITPETAPSRAYLELMAEAGSGAGQPASARCPAGKALFDPLTGLRNRHHLEDTLRTQIAQAMRNDEPVSCMMIDIDHFKSINDRFGHEAGDHVIKSVATIVQRAVHDAGPPSALVAKSFWCYLRVRMRTRLTPAQRRFITASIRCRYVMGLLRLAR